MIKELFYSETCLHFKTLHPNISYNTVVFDNLSLVGGVYGMKHWCEFLSPANPHLFIAQERNKLLYKFTVHLPQANLYSAMLTAGCSMKRNTMYSQLHPNRMRHGSQTAQVHDNIGDNGPYACKKDASPSYSTRIKHCLKCRRVTILFLLSDMSDDRYQQLFYDWQLRKVHYGEGFSLQITLLWSLHFVVYNTQYILMDLTPWKRMLCPFIILFLVMCKLLVITSSY